MSARGKVRITGGKWKRRYLHFPSLPQLRPSPEASRETLFNWLGPEIVDSVCLDLFAGSGALGFEAASRGAARVDLVESHPAAWRALLNSSLPKESEGTVFIHRQDAIRYLESSKMRYDIVFLDPPFKKNILPLTFETLVRRGRLNESATIYVEFVSGQLPLSLPEGWSITRHTRRGKSTSVLIGTLSTNQ